MGTDYPGTGTGKRPRGGDQAQHAHPLADLGARVAVALPAAAATVLVVMQGGLLLVLVVALLGAAAVWEAYRLMGVPTRARVVGALTVALLPPAALLDGPQAILLVLVAAVPVTFLAAAGRDVGGASRDVAATMLGIVWVGVALAHGVLLRELPDGELLVIGVLVGTFLGDTAAHLLGAAFGRTQIAPRLSPAKTVEGLLAGIAGGTLSLYLFMVVADGPAQGVAAVTLGAAVAIAAPAGDLFESLFKRDAGQKDSGRALGAHGGILDRIDAVLFTLVAGYYVARLVL
jgi:phosphatidate cytidylyltransferase